MGSLIHGWVGILSFGMAILGGYWPIIITFSPLLVLNPVSIFGVIIALPQILPFLWYWPRSIRSKKRPDPSFGRMPVKRYFLDLRFPENGMIHYPEYTFGIGLCGILAFFHPSFWWIFALIGFIGSQGWFIIDRVPARWVYLVGISLIFCSLNAIRDTIYALPMIVGQAFLLWKWRYQYPSFPFSQWWRREHVYKGTDWPNNTGYMNNAGHQKYFGGFSLEENYRE